MPPVPSDVRPLNRQEWAISLKSTGNKATVIIPVKNGLPHFRQVCEALKRQKFAPGFEVICIDSGSTDASVSVAKSHGWRIEHIPPSEFGHGRTRNFAATLGNSEFIVFLTHDAIPANDLWLANLLQPLEEDPDIAGAFSRHVAHTDADPFVAWEIQQHFRGLEEFPVVQITDRAAYDADIGLQQIYHFFSDNSSALRRSVWAEFPLPDVQFAEDQIWAKTIVEAGYKKAFAANSVVRHSHAFGPWDTLRRSFDESRAFHRLFGYRLAGSVRGILRSSIYLIRRDIGNALRYGWWRTHPAKTISRTLESFARPLGHYLGCRKNLPRFVLARISRDDWIKSL